MNSVGCLLPEATLQSKHEFLEVHCMPVQKTLLAQPMIRIRILPVMPATKRNSGEVGCFLPYSSCTQRVRVRRFDDGHAAVDSCTDHASKRSNPSQILRASVRTPPRPGSDLAHRHSPLRRQTPWRRLRQSGRRAHLACVNGNVKISRRRARNHPGQYRPASGWFSKWKT
jgi:hypothetical protein